MNIHGSCIFHIDYLDKGYFVAPTFQQEITFNPTDDPWIICAMALHCAKKNDFSLVPILMDHYATSHDPLLKSMCSELLSVAGPASCFSRIVNEVTNNPKIEDNIGYIGALAYRGELSYIPILLNIYEANRENRDSICVLDFISNVLGDISCYPDYEDYPVKALEHYHNLRDRFNTDKVIILGGDKFSVTSLAEKIMDCAKEPHFQFGWRRCFEAATGIDCSSWYKDRLFQPLNTISTLEEFLHSDEAEKYEPGIRYFFGNRIPD